MCPRVRVGVAIALQKKACGCRVLWGWGGVESGGLQEHQAVLAGRGGAQTCGSWRWDRCQGHTWE